MAESERPNNSVSPLNSMPKAIGGRAAAASQKGSTSVFLRAPGASQRERLSRLALPARLAPQQQHPNSQKNADRCQHDQRPPGIAVVEIRADGDVHAPQRKRAHNEGQQFGGGEWLLGHARHSTSLLSTLACPRLRIKTALVHFGSRAVPNS